MKTLKLVISIISMVLFLLIALQSCAAGVGNALAENGESSGSAGILLAFAMLIAGIIGVAAGKGKGGSIAAAIIYVLGGIIGIANVGSYSDLKIWSILSFVFAIIFIISIFVTKKPASNTEA